MKNKKTIVIASVLFALMVLATMPDNANAYTSVDAIVVLKPGYSLETLDSVQYLRQYEAINGFYARMPYSVFNWLKNQPGVAISENGLVHMMEDTLDWGVDAINAEVVWGGAENAVNVVSGNVDGSGIKVCVIDTGIDVDHTDLDANYKGGYDFVNSDSNPNDDNGHGTHCAGIIGAEDNGAGVIGVAPKVSLYAAKVLDSSGSGTFDNVVAGINWAVSNGMDVASMSLGASSGTTALQQACQNAWAAGVIICAASGNEGSTVGYPATYSSTIAVGAVDSSLTRASWSNYGSALDVVAPGVSIYSTYNTGGYTTMSGTSMATPMVSGTVAMILCANPALTPAEVLTILQTTSTDLGTSGFDIYYGYGLVNVAAAVEAAGGGGGEDTTPPTVTITSPSDGATVSGSVTVTASASDNVGVTKVSLRIDSGTWTDDTASPYSWTWDTTAYADGSHTVTCRAYDAAGNYADDTNTVTVSNGGTPPPTTDTWGITSSSFTSVSTHTNARYMGGTSPSEEITVTSLWIRCGTSGTVSIALYTGGSLTNPRSAVRRAEAHGIAVSAGWNEIDVPDYTVAPSTITWIGWAIAGSVYYSTSSSNAGDFQTARGAWSQYSPSNYVETSALPTNPSYGSFVSGWYAVYAEYTTAGGGEPEPEPITYTFTGSVSQGYDSTSHSFIVPSNALTISVTLTMASGADWDLSVWDAAGLRTGGWTSSESSTSNEIANGAYSGYSASPEWVTVNPVASFGTWLVGCYAYSGSGTYTITVTITVSS